MNLERMKEMHDNLRKKIIYELDSSGDYLYPEAADGFYVGGESTKEPDFNVLADFCEYVCTQGTSDYDGNWEAQRLFEFLKKELVLCNKGKRYHIHLDFGGISPVVALLPFLFECSNIDSLDVSFTHDKWEARGDYQAETRIGLKLRNKQVVVETYNLENEDDDFDLFNYNPTPNNMVLDENNILIKYKEIEEDKGELACPTHVRGISRDVLLSLKITKKITLCGSCKIFEGMFSEIECLEELDLSASYQEIIPINLCKNCNSLRKVVLSDRIFKIEDGAFENCTNLYQINIPKAIMCAGKTAFSGCDKLPNEVKQKVLELIKDPDKFERLALESITYIKSHGLTTYKFGYGYAESYRYLFAMRAHYEKWHEMYDKCFDALTRLSKGRLRYVLYVGTEKMKTVQKEYQFQLEELMWKQTKEISAATDFLVVDTNDIPNFDRFISKQQRLASGDIQGASVFGNNALEKAVKLKEEGGKIKILSLELFCKLLEEGDFEETIVEDRTEEVKAKREAEKAAKKENKESQCEDLIASIVGKSKEQGILFTNAEIVSIIEESEVPLRRLEKYISDKHGKTLKEIFEDFGVLKTVKTEFCALVKLLKQRYESKPKVADVTALIADNADLDLSIIANNAKRFTGLSTREYLISEGILVGAEVKTSEPLTEGVLYKPGEEPEDIKKRIKTLFEKLDGAYPDKVIVGLHKDHKKWGETVTDLYRKLGYKSGNDFLAAYGYTVADNQGGRPKADGGGMEVIEELKRRYPDGANFKDIQALFDANPDLTPKLNTLRTSGFKVDGMTFGKYLKFIGLMGK